MPSGLLFILCHTIYNYTCTCIAFCMYIIMHVPHSYIYYMWVLYVSTHSLLMLTDHNFVHKLVKYVIQEFKLFVFLYISNRYNLKRRDWVVICDHPYIKDPYITR